MYRSRRKGFTLIEMVVVLFILAVLAGLIVAIVAMIRRSAEMAGSAKNQADVANNIQLFYALQSRYPQGLDSLVLSAGGGLYVPEGTTTDDQTGGLSLSSVDGMTPIHQQLTVGTLTNAAGAEYLRSFSRSGFDWVYDHIAGSTNANRSATQRRPATVGAAIPSGFEVAELNPTAPLMTRLLPAGLPAGGRVVVLGYGERNSALGKTSQNAPVFPGADGRYYARFLCYFLLSPRGERATLVGVTDCMGRVPDYTIQEFNASLPDGGRQP